MSAAADYCLARSRWLRLRPADSRWLIDLAVAELPPNPPRKFHRRKRRWQGRLMDSLRGRPPAIRQSNPRVVPATRRRSRRRAACDRVVAFETAHRSEGDLTWSK